MSLSHLPQHLLSMLPSHLCLEGQPGEGLLTCAAVAFSEENFCAGTSASKLEGLGTGAAAAGGGRAGGAALAACGAPASGDDIDTRRGGGRRIYPLYSVIWHLLRTRLTAAAARGERDRLPLSSGGRAAHCAVNGRKEWPAIPTVAGSAWLRGCTELRRSVCGLCVRALAAARRPLRALRACASARGTATRLSCRPCCAGGGFSIKIRTVSSCCRTCAGENGSAGRRGEYSTCMTSAWYADVAAAQRTGVAWRRQNRRLSRALRACLARGRLRAVLGAA